MKRKEILIIFLLAVFLTLASSLYFREIGFVSDQPTDQNVPTTVSPIGYKILALGFPLAWLHVPENRVFYTNLIANFLFWFLVLAVGYQLIKWVRQIFPKKAG